ncbi:hypothetical protein PG995_013844 [Apiospora arundinis]
MATNFGPEPPGRRGRRRVVSPIGGDCVGKVPNGLLELRRHPVECRDIQIEGQLPEQRISEDHRGVVEVQGIPQNPGFRSQNLRLIVFRDGCGLGAADSQAWHHDGPRRKAQQWLR